MLVVDVATGNIDVQFHANGTKINPRGDSWDTRDLETSLATEGLIEPIVVRPAPAGNGRFLLIHGERRLTAAKKLGWKKVPAVIKQSSEDAESDVTADIMTMLASGMAHKDYNVYGVALAVEALVRADVSFAKISASTGMDKDNVATMYDLVTKDMSPRLREAIKEGRMSISALTKIKNTSVEFQESLLDTYPEGVITRKMVIDFIKAMREAAKAQEAADGDDKGDEDDYEIPDEGPSRSEQWDAIGDTMDKLHALLEGYLRSGVAMDYQRETIARFAEAIGRMA